MKKTLLSYMILGILISSVCFIDSASANLVIDPARLGILRLQLYPLSPAVAVREFRIGNTYDVPMYVELEPTEGLEDYVTVSESSFTLQPNEDKIVEYTVAINETGYYYGSILVKAATEGGATVGYNAGLDVFVNEGDLQPYLFAGIVIAVLIFILVVIIVYRRISISEKASTKRKKRGKRNEE